MKPVAARLPEHEYRVVKELLKEFRLSISDFIRGAVIHEIQRLKSLSKEEKMEEIKDNVEWNRSKYLMSSK